MIDSCVPPEFATTIESPYAPSVSRGHSAMPHGCGPAVGMPAVTNVEFAAWTISTRDNDGFVGESSRWLAEEIAWTIPPANGSVLGVPATLGTASARDGPGGLGMVKVPPGTARIG